MIRTLRAMGLFLVFCGFSVCQVKSAQAFRPSIGQCQAIEAACYKAGGGYGCYTDYEQCISGGDPTAPPGCGNAPCLINMKFSGNSGEAR